MPHSPPVWPVGGAIAQSTCLIMTMGRISHHYSVYLALRESMERQKSFLKLKLIDWTIANEHMQIHQML